MSSTPSPRPLLRRPRPSRPRLGAALAASWLALGLAAGPPGSLAAAPPAPLALPAPVPDAPPPALPGGPPDRLVPPASPALPGPPPQAAPSQAPRDALAMAVLARIATPDPGWNVTQAEREALHRLYEPGGHAPLWSDAAGRPTRNAADALRLLDDAQAEGLDPADYRPGPLAERVAHLRSAATPAEAERAALDVGLSLGVLRYMHHLHLGRVEPAELGFRVPARLDDEDLAVLLRAALERQQLPQAMEQLAPQTAQYRALREALRHYRALAADPALAASVPLAGTVRPGEPLPGAPALRRRLAALGDLPPEAAQPLPSALPPAYDGELVEGVRRFQQRHGLAPDGVLGPQTRAALEVPLAQRVRQIELALERLRWLPRQSERPYLSVNIPMFRLAVRDPGLPDDAPPLAMDVIVGASLDTQTPVFAEEMRYLVFRPYWNIPRRIALQEILPRLAGDPQYLAKRQMEIVRGWGDRAPVVEATPENVERLRLGQGGLRLRQRPGPHNSLGAVKFIFPNADAIYLHGTPQKELFGRARRDLSHGCVRVQDPAALAEWVLRDQPEWTRERIEAAMRASRPVQVNLKEPLQVLLYYYTADVMPEEGTVRFARDIYGHDAKLERALASRQGGL